MYAKHGPSASQALHNVFVLPALSKSLPQRRIAQHTISGQHTRPLLRSFHQSSIHNAKTRAAEERTQKWNEEITARMIQLVDSETNKLLDDGQPRTKWDILNTIDTKTHRLVQLSPDEPGNRNFIPVCKIVSKKESYEAELRRKKQAKDQKRANKIVSEMGAKTLELNWAIDQNHDLLHRIEKMKAFLSEGRRVEIVLASKKGGRKATREECEGVLNKIRQAAGEIEGVKESKEFSGKLGGFGTMSFQGRPVVVKKEEKQKQDQAEDASE